MKKENEINDLNCRVRLLYDEKTAHKKRINKYQMRRLIMWLWCIFVRIAKEKKTFILGMHHSQLTAFSSVTFIIRDDNHECVTIRRHILLLKISLSLSLCIYLSSLLNIFIDENLALVKDFVNKMMDNRKE